MTSTPSALPTGSDSNTAPDTAIPLPRPAALVFRGNPRPKKREEEAEVEKHHRPGQRVNDIKVMDAFARENEVNPGKCWVTARKAQGFHMIPHSESQLSRLCLWLQLMELAPVDTADRNKWKVSPTNLVPIHYDLHQMLADNQQRRALIRPTRADLNELVRVLETALAMEEVKLTEQANRAEWQPDWNGALHRLWHRKVVIEQSHWNSYELQVDLFDFEYGELVTVKSEKSDADNSNPFLREAPGTRTRPNTLSKGLGLFYAPLCVLSLTALALSQVAFLSQEYADNWLPEFLEDVEIMSYIVEIMSAGHPSYFRRCSRPRWIDVDLPSQVSSVPEMRVRRVWPESLWPSDSASGQELFSSSPLSGGQTIRPPALFGPMHPVKTEESQLSTTSDDEMDVDDKDDQDDAGEPRGPPGARPDDPDESGKSQPSSGETSLNSSGSTKSWAPSNTDAHSEVIASPLTVYSLTVPEKDCSIVDVGEQNADRGHRDVPREHDSARDSEGAEEDETGGGEDQSESVSEGEEDESDESDQEEDLHIQVGSRAWDTEGEKLLTEQTALYRELAADFQAKLRQASSEAATVLIAGLTRSAPASIDGRLKSIEKKQARRERRWLQFVENRLYQ